MKVGVFCRVSTLEQVKKGVSIHDQRQRGIEFCKENGFEYELFEERGSSGELPLEERPVLCNLLEKTKKIKNKDSEIQAVYVVDFDRLSRNDLVSVIIKSHFISNNIIIYDKGLRIDLSDSNANLLSSISSALASYEIKKLRERIKRSLERNVIDGKVGGGCIYNYGYTKGANNELIIDDDEAEIVKKIFTLASEGFGTKKIASILNEEKIPTKRNRIPKGKLKVRGKDVSVFTWKPGTIYSILKNPIYYGLRQYKGSLYPAPSIIEKTKFDFVQKALIERKNFKDTTNKYNYLLKGLIVCGNCANRFYGRKRADLSDNQYICLSQREGNFCGNRGINIDKIDNLVWNYIVELPKNIERMVIKENDTYIKNLILRRDKTTNKLLLQEKKKDVIIEQIFRNENLKETLQSNLDNISEEIEKSKKNLSEIMRELDLASNHNKLVTMLYNQLNPIKNKDLGFDEKQKITRAFVKGIIVKWFPQASEHVVVIHYKVTELSDLSLQGLCKISYQKMGFTYRSSKISYDFRVVSPKTKLKLKDGKISEIQIQTDKDDLGFSVEDMDLERFDFLLNK